MISIQLPLYQVSQVASPKRCARNIETSVEKSRGYGFHKKAITVPVPKNWLTEGDLCFDAGSPPNKRAPIL